MAEIILNKTGLTATDSFHTIHNYIDTNEMILRKGAIAAHKDKKILISYCGVFELSSFCGDFELIFLTLFRD